MKEQVYQIALTLLPKVGPVTARNLVSYCGGPQNVFTASRKELRRIPRIGPKLAELIYSQQILEKAQEEFELLEKEGITLLFYLDEAYPARLKPFEDSPVCLYFKGNAALSPARSIGIVGTRTPSTYGMVQCEKLVEELARYHPTIVSGLAYGIDSIAHRISCQQKIPTIGVLANGLGTTYPSAHHQLAERMLHRGGLLSEHPFHTLPEKEFFPMRNRIIAALVDAVVVVESGKTGGSLITAEFANRYNREVFALPGRITDDRSAGCHFLLKNHKATLFESAEDIGQWMGWDTESQEPGIQAELFPTLEGHAKIIVDLLGHSGQKSIDEIIIASGLPAAGIMSTLLDLECSGLVKALPGKRFMLAR